MLLQQTAALDKNATFFYFSFADFKDTEKIWLRLHGGVALMLEAQRVSDDTSKQSIRLYPLCKWSFAEV